MNNFFFAEVTPIPSFQEIKQKPNDAGEAIWLILIFFVLFGFYVGKDVVQGLIKINSDKASAQLEAEKSIRKEREERIEFLEEQIKMLYHERAFLMKASGINSDFLKAEVTSVNQK